MLADLLGGHDERLRVHGHAAMLFGNAQKPQARLDERGAVLRKGLLLLLAGANVELVELQMLLEELIDAVQQQLLLVGFAEIHATLLILFFHYLGTRFRHYAEVFRCL